MSCFLLRIKFTAWAYGALQQRRRHFLISRTRNIKLAVLIELDESFPTIQNLGVGEPPFSINSWSKLKIWPPISPPPKALGGQFLYHAMRDPQESLSSETSHAGPIPDFLANFFPKFSASFGFQSSEDEFSKLSAIFVPKLGTLTEWTL